jgi:hypothetical protein
MSSGVLWLSSTTPDTFPRLKMARPASQLLDVTAVGKYTDPGVAQKNVDEGGVPASGANT